MKLFIYRIFSIPYYIYAMFVIAIRYRKTFIDAAENSKDINNFKMAKDIYDTTQHLKIHICCIFWILLLFGVGIMM